MLKSLTATVCYLILELATGSEKGVIPYNVTFDILLLSEVVNLLK